MFPLQFKYTVSIIKVNGLKVATGLEKCEKGMYFSYFFIFFTSGLRLFHIPLIFPVKFSCSQVRTLQISGRNLSLLESLAHEFTRKGTS